MENACKQAVQKIRNQSGQTACEKCSPTVFKNANKNKSGILFFPYPINSDLKEQR